MSDFLLKNTAVESTLAKYLEFRIFEVFKNRIISEISPHCRENSKEDLYKHLFLCPSQLSKKRNFQLTGVLSPFVCLWRTSLLEWNTKFYGRSVLPRDFEYIKKNGEHSYERGYLYDLQFNIELFSSSYYKTFRDRINQDLLDLDRIRYFYIDIPELIKDCSELKTRIELMLTGIKPTDNASNDETRSFDLNASYTIKITLPYCHSDDYLSGIEVYINNNIIYQHDGITEIIPGVEK